MASWHHSIMASWHHGIMASWPVLQWFGLPVPETTTPQNSQHRSTQVNAGQCRSTQVNMDHMGLHCDDNPQPSPAITLPGSLALHSLFQGTNVSHVDRFETLSQYATLYPRLVQHRPSEVNTGQHRSTQVSRSIRLSTRDWEQGMC